MTSPLLFDRGSMLRALEGLDRVMIERGLPHQRLVIVGGSYLALGRLRESTRDVDTVTRLGGQLRSAIAVVGAELGLAATWLNDSSTPFRPTGLVDDDCEIAFEGAALVALVPPPDWIFLMKLNAGRVVDRPDMVRLWPLAGNYVSDIATEATWPEVAGDSLAVPTGFEPVSPTLRERAGSYRPASARAFAQLRVRVLVHPVSSRARQSVGLSSKTSSKLRVRRESVRVGDPLVAKQAEGTQGRLPLGRALQTQCD